MPQKGKAGPVMTELSGEVRAMANGFAAIETERGFVVLELMGARARCRRPASLGCGLVTGISECGW